MTSFMRDSSECDPAILDRSIDFSVGSNGSSVILGQAINLFGQESGRPFNIFVVVRGSVETIVVV